MSKVPPPIVNIQEKTHWTKFDNSSFEAKDDIGLGFS